MPTPTVVRPLTNAAGKAPAERANLLEHAGGAIKRNIRRVNMQEPPFARIRKQVGLGKKEIQAE